MLLVLVTVFGLIVVWQLHGINRQLQDSRRPEESRPPTPDLSVVVTALESLRNELQWHKKLTFASELREWIEEGSKIRIEELQEGLKTIIDELQGHENFTFARDLQGWIQTATTDIVAALVKIDDNTSYLGKADGG